MPTTSQIATTTDYVRRWRSAQRHAERAVDAINASDVDAEILALWDALACFGFGVESHGRRGGTLLVADGPK